MFYCPHYTIPVLKYRTFLVSFLYSRLVLAVMAVSCCVGVPVFRYLPHMLGFRLTLKHCNCHISQELIWSEPEPVLLLSSSGPPRLRLYRRHSATVGRRHREHIPSLSSQSRHHNSTRFMEMWSRTDGLLKLSPCIRNQSSISLNQWLPPSAAKYMCNV